MSRLSHMSKRCPARQSVSTTSSDQQFNHAKSELISNAQDYDRTPEPIPASVEVWLDSNDDPWNAFEFIISPRSKGKDRDHNLPDSKCMEPLEVRLIYVVIP